MNTQNVHAYFCTYIRYLLLACCISIAASENVSAHHFRDTLHFKPALAEKKALVLSDSALNEIGLDSLLGKIENVHATLIRINQAGSTGFNTHDIEENLPDIDSNIEIIDENLTLYSSVLDVKNLQMFEILLSSLQDQLNDWRTTVFKYNKELIDMSNEMGAYRKDTVLRSLMADSAFKSLYINEINDLKSKWHDAKLVISTNQTRINQLQAMLSNEYFTTIDLQNKIHALLKKISVKSTGKEYDYLWAVNDNAVTETNSSARLAGKAYSGQRKILKYYFRRNWDNQAWMFITGLIFLLWIFRNFHKLEKSKGADTIPVLSYTFIKKLPVLATLVVLFNISPFFDIHPPTAYVDIMEFLLVISLTLLLWRNWPKELFYYWLAMGALYFICSFTGALLAPVLSFRLALLALSLVSVTFGIFWFRIIRRHTLIFSGMIRFVSVVYVILNFAAAWCNLFGRISLAKIFTVTAIHGLTQIIGLSVFIQIVTEAFHLQTMVNKARGGLVAKLDFEKIQRLLTRALVTVSVVIWIIVFTISLNLYNIIFHVLTHILTRQRTIGNTSFQLGNILLFLAIIYVSNLLQQGIGSLYGKPQGNWDPEVKKNGSRLAMTRLIFIVLGFLIAVAASGLPMDKITIVLGALGVGIGLGLQAIVNNLVSGVILIFEQPFRIGDFIEIGDKKGRVLDIGIRSSKLVMEEGAEMIIPNGDLLSGRVINWTTRNENARIELPIAVVAGQSLEKIQKIIVDVLSGNEHVVGSINPEILLSGVTDKVMNLNVLVWINDVQRLKSIQSELLNDVYNSLTREDIKIA